MERELTSGLLRAEEYAHEATRKQIEKALELNAKYFNGEGLKNVPAILQALATNFNAAVLYDKTVK